MELEYIINKIPSYITKNNNFYKFIKEIDKYIFGSYDVINKIAEEINGYLTFKEYASNGKEYKLFSLQFISNILGIKSIDSYINDPNYMNYLDIMVKGVLINNNSVGTIKSISNNFSLIFPNCLISVKDEGNMKVKFDISNIELSNLPFSIFKNYITPSVLGVEISISFAYGDIFCYDLDFNEAVYNYSKNIIKEGYSSTDEYIKACRSIVITSQSSETIDMWIHPELYDGVIVESTFYGFSNALGELDYYSSNPKNESKYIMEV